MDRTGPTSRRAIVGTLVGAIALAAGVLALLTAGGGVETLPQATAGAKKPSSLARCAYKVTGIGALESAVGRVRPGSVICLLTAATGRSSSRVTGAAGSRFAPSIPDGDDHRRQPRGRAADPRPVQHSRRSHDRARLDGRPSPTTASPVATWHQRRPHQHTNISDTTIQGNKLVGPFGEDALRINRYHDSGDSDPYGILIEGNEITGVRENGAHSDCLQSVWGGDNLYFRRNYLHDNRCQGFFVKDQPEAISRVVLSQNLMVRNAAPCEPPDSGCGAPSIVQIFGPTAGLRLAHNTIWTASNRSPVGAAGRTVRDDHAREERSIPSLERLERRLPELRQPLQPLLPMGRDPPRPLVLEPPKLLAPISRCSR